MDSRSREHQIELNEAAEQFVSQSDNQISQDSMQSAGDLLLAIDFGVSTEFVFETPKLGMVFQSDNHAYDFYNRYARSVGFSIRKNSSTHRSNKTISRRVFCCSKEGFRCTHSRGPPMKARPQTRTDCKARLVIKLQDDGRYSVIEFIKKHNHELAPPSEVHTLRSQRKLQDPQAAGLIDDMNCPTIGSPGVYSCTSGEEGGSQDFNFMQVDCNSYLQKRKRNDILEKGDAQLLLDYFKRMEKDNPYFFYAIRMDDNNQIGSCFWCDAKSRIDYSFFGDVVCFDTTYKINEYNRPYAPFAGVNNHGQFILFGCALILDDTIESFIWLFSTFLDAMSRKKPKVLFTDQSVMISDAIRQVFPDTYHRIGLWHICQDAMKSLSHVFENFKSFAKDFSSCIYDTETEEKFQSNWDTMIEKYNLAGNIWLQDLYGMREKWLQVFGRLEFCAGMISAQRSESMSKFLKKYFKRTLPLREFVVLYDKVLTVRREKEKNQDIISRQSKPNLRTMWPAEARAAERYTRKMFKLFQDDYVGTLDLFAEAAGEDGTICTYKVSSFENVKPHIVTFDTANTTVECSCKKFELMGILCAHALKVLHSRRLLDLPSQYYLKRWTKDARAGAVVNSNETATHMVCASSVTLRHNELAHMAQTLAVKGATTENSRAYAKQILSQALEEIDIFLEMDFNRPRHPEDNGTSNHDNEGQETVADHFRASTMFRDPLNRISK